MRLRKVLVAGALALAEIGDRVQPESVDAEVEPTPHDLHQGHQHARIVEIQIRLVREEAVPVIGLRGGIPGPVGFFRIVEDNAGAGITLVAVAPDIPCLLYTSDAADERSS